MQDVVTYIGTLCPACGEAHLEPVAGCSDSIGTPQIICPQCGEVFPNAGYYEALDQE